MWTIVFSKSETNIENKDIAEISKNIENKDKEDKNIKKINGYTLSEIIQDLKMETKSDGFIKLTKQKYRNKDKRYSQFSFRQLDQSNEEFFMFINSSESGLRDFHLHHTKVNLIQEKERNKRKFKNALKESFPYCNFIIYYKNDPVGEFALYLSDNDSSCISYSLTLIKVHKDQPFHGRGFGTLMLEQIMDFIFILRDQGIISKDIKKIEAAINIKNTPSIRTVLKNGFSQFGKPQSIRGSLQCYRYIIEFDN